MKIEEWMIFRIGQIGWGISWFFVFLFLFIAYYGIELHIAPYWGPPVLLLMLGSVWVMETHSNWLA